MHITVTTVGGTSTMSNADQYFYGATFPTVTSLSQKYGAETGGALLTITGTNFSSSSGISVSDVFFGARDVPVSNAYPCLGATSGCFTVVSPTQISAYALRPERRGTCQRHGDDHHRHEWHQRRGSVHLCCFWRIHGADALPDLRYPGVKNA